MMGRLHNAEQRAEELRRTLEDRERTHQNKVLEERAHSRQDLDGIKNQLTSMEAQLESKKITTRVRDAVQQDEKRSIELSSKLERALTRIDTLEASVAKTSNMETVLRELPAKAAPEDSREGADAHLRLVSEVARLGAGLADLTDLRAQVRQLGEKLGSTDFKATALMDTSTRHDDDIRAVRRSLSDLEHGVAQKFRAQVWEAPREREYREQVLPAQKPHLRFMDVDEVSSEEGHQSFDPMDVRSWRPWFEGKNRWEIEQELQRIFLRGESPRTPPVHDVFQTLANWVESAVTDPALWADAVGMGGGG
ncbi:hypothetical protein NESM_000889600 [Novymonas esmeraldas]|uniref:Uncharacterized protein n=1 Tax=Novymonas esmeraldas TaxID=1808958 RepID=A0AAW0EZH3_9TRYP